MLWALKIKIVKEFKDNKKARLICRRVIFCITSLDKISTPLWICCHHEAIISHRVVFDKYKHWYTKRAQHQIATINSTLKNHQSGSTVLRYQVKPAFLSLLISLEKPFFPERPKIAPFTWISIVAFFVGFPTLFLIKSVEMRHCKSGRPIFSPTLNLVFYKILRDETVRELARLEAAFFHFRFTRYLIKSLEMGQLELRQLDSANEKILSQLELFYMVVRDETVRVGIVSFHLRFVRYLIKPWYEMRHFDLEDPFFHEPQLGISKKRSSWDTFDSLFFICDYKIWLRLFEIEKQKLGKKNKKSCERSLRNLRDGTGHFHAYVSFRKLFELGRSYCLKSY